MKPNVAQQQSKCYSPLVSDAFALVIKQKQMRLVREWGDMSILYT
jgi:hypothetical protein